MRVEFILNDHLQKKMLVVSIRRDFFIAHYKKNIHLLIGTPLLFPFQFESFKQTKDQLALSNFLLPSISKSDSDFFLLRNPQSKAFGWPVIQHWSPKTFGENSPCVSQLKQPGTGELTNPPKKMVPTHKCCKLLNESELLPPQIFFLCLAKPQSP